MITRKSIEREYTHRIKLEYDGLIYKIEKRVSCRGDDIEYIIMYIAENYIDKDIRKGKLRYYRDKHNIQFMKKYRAGLNKKLFAILDTLMQENIKEEMRYKILENILKGAFSEKFINSTYKSLVVLQNHRKGQEHFRKPKNINV